MKIKCEGCGSNFPHWDTVSYGTRERSRDLCTRCFNQEVATLAGIDFDDPSFQAVTMMDRRHKRHTFHFRSRLVPTGRTIEAFELFDGNPGGYQFKVLGDAEADPLTLYQTLYERMQRAMRIEHLERHNGSPWLPYPGIVRGGVEYDSETDDACGLPSIVIDGHSFGWVEFGRMLMAYEGWNFRLQMIDPTDEDYLDTSHPPHRRR